ncbi:unnamed protein product, partial [marine sediment metagenome]
IQTQGVPTLRQNTAHYFQFHVYNISTGLHVDDTTTNCTFHLYNKTGENQIEKDFLSSLTC